MYNILHILSLFIILFAGCYSSNLSSDKAELNTDLLITGKYLKLIELMGKPVKMFENQQREAHMILKQDGNRVNGFGSCNTFNGSFELKERNRISFSKMVTTLKACPEMETESQFFKVLEMTDNYNFDGKYLQLNKAKMAPLAKFEVVWFD
jgi:copper homeostasis protein (lipoprotein)